MTETYRQKLLNWFSSPLLVAAGGILPPLIFWLDEMPSLQQITLQIDFSDFAGPLGESFLLYPAIFPLVIFWHFWDFLQRPTNPNRLYKYIKYRIFIRLIFFELLLFVIMTSKAFERNSCDSLPSAYFYQCVIGPHPWLVNTWYTVYSVIVISCLLKAIGSIRSFFSYKS